MIRSLPVLLVACGPAVPDAPDRAPIEASEACAPDRPARVGCAIDGDTLDLGTCGPFADERIRVLGIDAPEVGSDGGASECYGDEATAALRALVEGRDVALSFDQGCTDPFGRTLAWVHVADPRRPDTPPINVSVWMVERGFARLYRERDDFAEIRFGLALLAAEEAAQDVGAGLWSACGG